MEECVCIKSSWKHPLGEESSGKVSTSVSVGKEAWKSCYSFVSVGFGTVHDTLDMKLNYFLVI